MIGSHSLKFGVKWSKRGGGRFDIANSLEQYSNKANLLANIPDSITVNFGNNPFTYRMFELGLFAQDDWRVTPRLTLNLGLRYEAETGLKENNNQLAVGFDRSGIDRTGR